MRRALLITLASSSLACSVSAPSAFGRVCTVDAECDDLVCLDNHCRPTPAPVELRGLSCDGAIPVVFAVDGDVLVGVGDGVMAAGSATLPACSGGRDGGSIVFSVALSAPIVARIRVDGDLSASIAVVDDTCTSPLDHGCAAGAARGAKDLVLPFVEDGAKIVVSSAQIGAPFRLIVEQLHCPPGFVPDGDGCAGFLAIPGPAPRTGHEVTRVDDLVIVSGGAGVDAALYDPARHSFSVAQQIADRVDHAAAVAEGRLFLVGGVAGDESDRLIEFLEPDDGSFTSLDDDFIFLEALGEKGTLTVMPGLTPFLYVGGAIPLRATFAPFGAECEDDNDCDNAGVCLQIIDGGSTPIGQCGCVGEDCSHFTVARPFWSVAGSFPDAARFRRRHSACDTSVGGDAEVAIVGGLAGSTPGLPVLYLQAGDFWLDLGEGEDAPSPRLDAAAACVDELMVLIGGRALDETPLATIEAYAPQTDAVVGRGELARPRADAVSVVLDGGDILVIGGDDGTSPLISTELVTAANGASRVGPRLPAPLARARAAKLPDGDVLVVGGVTVDGVLVTDAFLYTHVEPRLDPPPLDVITRPIRPGDVCSTPIVLAGSSGTFQSDTFTFENNVEIFSVDSSCTGFQSPGLDAFHVINVPAGATLGANAVSDEADVSLFAFDTCELTPPCLAGRDNDGVGSDESITFTNTTGTAMDVIVVVDGFDDPAPYRYTLTWSVTP